ncbi:tryptophan synthase subunit alpha [Saccharopolyspora sp. 5N708]|uniref:tryptophan synthase subunit alpha n=1 Tax=Saccharopolyspora sp. 5N708 TaxID=3457424 RepID=UPI003FD62F99
MAEFFTGRGPDRPGLAVLLTAGAQPLAQQRELLAVLDERGVDCVELAVPFPDSATDGPVLRRAADRALRRGIGFADVLRFVAGVRPHLRQLRIALLADWRYSVWPLGEHRFARQVLDAGVDGALVHATPPRRRAVHLSAAADTGLPMVASCFATSGPAARTAAARDATAYVYLAAHYGKTGTAPVGGHAALAGVVRELRAEARVPVAVGFGVRSATDVRRIAATGADAAIVGTAAAEVLDRAEADDHDPVGRFDEFVRSLFGGDQGKLEGATR